MRSWFALLASSTTALLGCDEPRVVPTNPTDPQTLIETGLCADARCERIAQDVLAFAPRYSLYSDGAQKRRWIALPDDTQIDTSDMDYWRFPVGTRLWKEFERDGVRVETRYLTKLLDDDAAPGAWLYTSFAWNAARDETTRAPEAGVRDANGTLHDIPSRSECQGCHDNMPTRVLGFGAMSLDGATPLSLAELVATDVLTQPLGALGDPAFPVPGTEVDRAAFGYLHANCGGCHNPRSRVHLDTPVELRLTTTIRSLDEVPARKTTVDVPGIVGGLVGPIVAPGDPDSSVMMIRTRSSEVPTKMPALGTEMVDPIGQDALSAWILQPP
ncbi:MAG: hypothetical protein ACKV2T_42245 [Kofleriaceae bacterium]